MSDLQRDLEACFIGEAERPLFAWVHRPASHADKRRGSVAAVLCNPFGYEAICAHRSYRHLAERLAELGVPALRFDYAGTGDSSPRATAPSVQGWVASTREAIDAAKRLTGADRVVLVGVRVGAMVAALTATGRDDVAGVVTIAPILSGRAYVRELRALQMALGLEPAPPSASAPPEGGQEAVGFYLDADAKAALSEVDLVKSDRAPAPRVFVLDRDDFPPSEKYLERLRSLGVAPDHARLPGYPEMMLDPHKMVVPHAIIDATSAWVAQIATDVGGELATPSRAAPGAEAAVTADVVERPVWIGNLFGITSAPRDRARRNGKAVVFLNAGSIHRVGPNELFARFARECASRGYVSLRLDLSGIGDSPARPGAPVNEAYSPRASQDIDEALAWLASKERTSDARLIGLCSGAYHGFKAATAGKKLRRAILINPLVYFHTEGMSLDFPRHKVSSEAKRYTASVFRADSWKKLLRGEVKVRIVAEILGRRAAGIARERTRDVLRRFDVPLENDVATELERARKHGVEIAFVFAECDPGHDVLLAEAGRTLPRLEQQGAVSIDVFQAADHTFTPVWSHAPLLDRLRELTERAG